MSSQSAVFLDRDGVLVAARVNEGRPYSLHDPAELRVLPGAEAACNNLRSAGFLLICVTNQPDIARGLVEWTAVERSNTWLQTELDLDDVRTCPHDDQAACTCRKPAPGLLVQAAEDWGIDLATSFMVGDRWRDIEAGQRAGCATVFVNRNYAERPPVAPTHVVANVGGAATWILSKYRPTRKGQANDT